MAETGFTLAPALADTSYLLGDWPLARVFLVDDARFPWLMLVPRRADMREIIDLAPEDRDALFSEMMRASEVLQALSKPDKLNIGALGNVVPQLHIHIVGRFVSDPAWPGPVWGFGERRPYPAHMAGLMMDKFKPALGFSA